MAHNLEYRDGNYSFVFSGEPAWHYEGSEVSEDITMAEMASKVKADYKTTTRPIFVDLSPWNGDKNHDTGRQAIIRDDTGDILTYTGSEEWFDADNSECIALADMIIAASNGSAKVSACGTLNGGATFYTIKLSESFDLFGKDNHNSFVNIINRHKFGTATFGNVSTIRTVCQNTVNMNLNSKVANKFRIAHGKPFNAEEAYMMLGGAVEKAKEYKEAAEFMASKSYTVESMMEYFNRLYPVTGKGIREKEISVPARRLADIINMQPGHDLAEGSWYSAFNAVTFFENHMRGQNDNRAESVLFGRANTKMQDAYALALDYAKAA